jgi:hypothetical protein
MPETIMPEMVRRETARGSMSFQKDPGEGRYCIVKFWRAGSAEGLKMLGYRVNMTDLADFLKKLEVGFELALEAQANISIEGYHKFAEIAAPKWLLAMMRM